MLYPFQIFFDVIFPPTKHELTLRSVTPRRFVSWYQPRTHEHIVSISEYHLPEIKAAVTACKFEQNYHAAQLLGALVQTHLTTLVPKKTIVIPVPLSARRKRKRQFNQVERVLQNIGQLPYPYTIECSLLARTLDTKPQTSLTRAERLKNVHQAFSVNKNHALYLADVERVIICDDVLTTGATLTAAKATLTPYLKPNIELLCLAWAH